VLRGAPDQRSRRMRSAASIEATFRRAWCENLSPKFWTRPPAAPH
jgi:hypothetical protein